MKARAMVETELRRRAMDGFAHFGIEAVISGKKVESTMPRELTAAQLFQVFAKYHLTPRQHRQVNQIVFDIANGKKVLYVAPRPAGAATVFKAAKEILTILKLPTHKLRKYETN